MIQIPNVTLAELTQLLTNLHDADSGVSITPATPRTGVISGSHKILWHTVKITANYALADNGDLTINADPAMAEGTIQQKINEALTLIRTGQ